MSSIPSYSELQDSLYRPKPPVRVYRDNNLDHDILARLNRQVLSENTPSLRAYPSTQWDQDKVLNTAHKNRILEIFKDSPENGQKGYNIKKQITGQYKGQYVVCLYKNTVSAKELLPILEKSI